MSDRGQRHVFVVTPKPELAEAVQDAIRGLAALHCYVSAVGCLEALHGAECDLLFADATDGSQGAPMLIRGCWEGRPGLSCVAIIRHGDVSMAVQCLKSGAADCLEQPLWKDAIIKTSTPFLEDGQRRTIRKSVVLTETEHPILAAVLDGLTTRQIAERLHRSPRTIEIHRRNIMRKLGVDNVADLVRRVARRGIEIKYLNRAAHARVRLD